MDLRELSNLPTVSESHTPVQDINITFGCPIIA